MNYENIILKKEEGIATITLNRPRTRNAITDEIRPELLDAIANIDKDNEVRVLVITGAGPGFSAGGDFSIRLFRTKSSVEAEEDLRDFNRILFGLRNLTKPTIAAVNGVAVGAGCNLALACDIIIASEKARFGEVFINLGIHTDTGGCYFVPRLVGTHKACELIFTGDVIDAKEAERIGLVNKVVPADQLESATKELALKLARKSPFALSMVKTSIYQTVDMSMESALEYEAKAQTQCLLTEDKEEGIKAFFEKREPVFKGK